MAGIKPRIRPLVKPVFQGGRNRLRMSGKKFGGEAEGVQPPGRSCRADHEKIRITHPPAVLARQMRPLRVRASLQQVMHDRRDLPRQQRRHGIAHLLVLLRARSLENVIVGKGLQTRRLAHRQAPALRRVVVNQVVSVLVDVGHGHCLTCRQLLKISGNVQSNRPSLIKMRDCGMDKFAPCLASRTIWKLGKAMTARS